jgi:hypothetical protein
MDVKENTEAEPARALVDNDHAAGGAYTEE